MAWLSSATSNSRLIDQLVSHKLVKDLRVEKAMRRVDRGNYSADLRQAYADHPHSIGYGQTISAPHMHAMCLELLVDQVSRPNARVLDVGSGSGYLSACFGRMLGEGGKVLGIDVVPELVKMGHDNMKKADKDLLDEGIVQMEVGDGWKGEPEFGPYDAIHVGAAAATLPQELVEQLKPEGRLIIPVGSFSQQLYQIDKAKDGQVSKRVITGVSYVPLVQRK